MATGRIKNPNAVETASITLASGITAARNRVRKVGSIVYLEFEITSTLTGGGYRNIGQLPSGYYRDDIPFVTATQIMLGINGYIRIGTAGNVDIYPSANASSTYIALAYSLV